MRRWSDLNEHRLSDRFKDTKFWQQEILIMKLCCLNVQAISMGFVKNVQDRKNGEGQLTYGVLKRRVWGNIENKSLLDNMMDKAPEK